MSIKNDRRQKQNYGPRFLFINELKNIDNDDLKETLKKDIPKRWEKHGDMIILPSNAFVSKDWHLVFPDTNFWDLVLKHFGCKRVARKASISKDDFRSSQIELIVGSDGWVTHIDNGISYSFDVTKCMFSAGNITEKLRIAGLNCKDEIIVDLYTGIGYFTLPFLVHCSAKHVHACEWNQNAVEALKWNLLANKVQERCTVYFGDNRQVCPIGIADRVNLGLIPTSKLGWETACKALKSNVGGFLHIHENVTSVSSIFKKDFERTEHAQKTNVTKNDKWRKKVKLKTEWTEWANKVATEINSILFTLYQPDFIWNVEILHIEHVKSYAPHVDHLVLDLECRPKLKNIN